ncbi:MAG: radical SAM protein [Candidatus Hydrothermarchaeales archaeon]
MDYEEVFSDSQRFLEIIKKADKKTREVHGRDVTLERAIFLSWWCDRGNCSFCYMSTQKERIKDKEKARRRLSSVLAEAELLRRIGWKAAFISGGYGVYSIPEIKEIAQRVHEIMGEPTWLNVGALSKDEMSLFDEEIHGVVGSVETVNEKLHREICPGKPLKPISAMLKNAKDLGLKTGITIILGLGEGVSNLPRLVEFVEEHEIDKITVYSLNPHEATPLSDSPPPASLYQAGVIAALRLKFPHLKIVAGTWIDQLPNIGITLLAGANGITKYPLFRMFGNRYGKKVEEEIAFAGRRVVGTFTDMTRLDGEVKTRGPEKVEVESALKRYVQKIERSSL